MAWKTLDSVNPERRQILFGGKTPAPVANCQYEYQRRRPAFLHALWHVRDVCPQESVRQMRGTAPTQVSDVEISVCLGVGGMFGASGCIVFGNDLS